MSDHMQWFTEARFGMFIHWGIYAIPARGEWIKQNESIPETSYQSYFDTFNPVYYDPRIWAKAAKEAGMKYVVMTSKHHDGFCLFDSKYTDYKATNTPAKRDLVKEYVEAFRAEGLKVGFYYSLLDWHHPDYPVAGDRIHPYAQPPRLPEPHGQPAALRGLHAQPGGRTVHQLWQDRYHLVRLLLRSHGGETWKATELVKMVRTLQPGIIIDNRLGGNIKASAIPRFTPGISPRPSRSSRPKVC